MPISVAKKAIISTSSRSSTESAFQRIQSGWTDDSWVPIINRYRERCTRTIKDDISTPYSINSSDLSEYISASILTHCFDGWSYLGRAVDALIKGDHSISRHLAYYAELRAGMSLLAGEGVGVFNQDHFVINATSECTRINKPGTHVFTWDALEHWATLPHAQDTILTLIRPGGVELKEWLQYFQVPANSMGLQAERWLKKWGLDLQEFAKDRDIRNEVSYRPTSIVNPSPLNAHESIDFVNEIWRTCESRSSNRFFVLDRHLLKESLHLYFKYSHPHGRTPKQAKKQFRAKIEQMISNISPGDISESAWIEFLTDTADDPLRIISEASKASDLFDKTHPFQVISRALLLLRVASGSCEKFVSSLPAYDRDELKFWWQPLGETRALWDSGNVPDDFMDLWSDIEEAIQVMEDLLDTPSLSYSNLWSDESANASIIGSAERIAFWGIGI